MRHWKFVDRRIDFPSKASKLGLLDEILIQIELLGFQFAPTFSPTDDLLRSEGLSQVLKLLMHSTLLLLLLWLAVAPQMRQKQNKIWHSKDKNFFVPWVSIKALFYVNGSMNVLVGRGTGHLHQYWCIGSMGRHSWLVEMEPEASHWSVDCGSIHVISFINQSINDQYFTHLLMSGRLISTVHVCVRAHVCVVRGPSKWIAAH